MIRKKFKIAIFSEFNEKSGGAYNEAQYLTDAIIKKIDKNFEFLLINNSEFTEFDTSVKVSTVKFNLNKLPDELIENIFIFIEKYSSQEIQPEMSHEEDSEHQEMMMAVINSENEN